MHTQYSDGKLSLAELIDFFGRRNFGAIAITDHLCEEKSFLGKAAAYLNKTILPSTFASYMDELREEKKRAWKQYGMLVIPGFELTKNSLTNQRSAHILALGVTEYIPADLDIFELIYSIKAAGGVAVAAHPVSRGKLRGEEYHLWDKREELADKFDAWEITDNGCLIPDVAKTKLPKLATSDLHRPNHLSSWKTLMYCSRSQDAILSAIRKQDLSFRYYEAAEPIPSEQRIEFPSGLVPQH